MTVIYMAVFCALLEVWGLHSIDKLKDLLHLYLKYSTWLSLLLKPVTFNFDP